MRSELKIGDLVECDDDALGPIASIPYDIHDGEVHVVDVLWSGCHKASRVDYTAFQNGAVKVIR